MEVCSDTAIRGVVHVLYGSDHTPNTDHTPTKDHTHSKDYTGPRATIWRPQIQIGRLSEETQRGSSRGVLQRRMGNICDDDFTLFNAHVLCRQLGFVEATGWTHSAKYGKGTGT